MKAKDVMVTNVITVGPEASVPEIANILRDELAPPHVRHGAPPSVQECTGKRSAQSAYHTLNLPQRGWQFEEVLKHGTTSAPEDVGSLPPRFSESRSPAPRAQPS
jgi:hypothetical protein